MLKSVVFGFTVTFVALSCGDTPPNPLPKVSRATTRTVVMASLAVVLALGLVLTTLMFSMYRSSAGV